MMKKDKVLRYAVRAAAAAGMILAAQTSAVFATQAEFKVINELQRQERELPPEVLIDRPSFTYTSFSERDPFDGLITKDEEKGTVQLSDSVEAPPPEMTVQGVIWGGAFPVAIINDQLVREGDKILDGVDIVNIEAYGVTYKYNDKEYTLPSPAVQGSSE